MSICDNCVNKQCIFQSGITRRKCDFYITPAQPQYTELTPEEAASEIASRSTMSAYYWLDDMIRLKQMGYAIYRKKGGD